MKTFHRGFTLIELMIVIAIVGILAAVIWPAIRGDGNPGGNTSYTPEQQGSPADNTTCIGGVAHHRGVPLIVGGNTVRC